ncbi:unnamed protein product [[Actinomadura] parvosata subsp. kistnae]|uniref:Uncharacterized protein n=1 Tax=[Actinomadura] parvosata subsp. kistnae TaxID=1909395 RepID=A0A1U9ZVP0_9ACTN|nr:hypothetical protein [Nonomuraea sp. ATCC 55076]AQZ62000.1 hypothetical protein BKM31_11410 [Nonomuraea sp. ATCC 55076]SPL99831.1 unnamed protein product [Actinomadura parvosata subsp. kistnae]
MSVGRLLSILAAALLPVSVLVSPAQARTAVPFHAALSGCPGAITEGTLEWVGDEVVKVEGNAAKYMPFPSCTRQSGLHSVAFRAYNGGTKTAEQAFWLLSDRLDVSLELTAPQGTPIDGVTVQICEFRVGLPGSIPPSSLLCLAPVRYQSPM